MMTMAGGGTSSGSLSDDQSLIIDYIIRLAARTIRKTTRRHLIGGYSPTSTILWCSRWRTVPSIRMLGYLQGGGRSDIDGLHGGETIPTTGRTTHPSRSLTPRSMRVDHSHQPVENQINGGKMNGFVTNFVAKFPEIDNPGKVMGYHTAAHVPVYDALASQFLICPHWFAAHPGPTFCNRFYTLTGRLNRDAFGGSSLIFHRMISNRPTRTLDHHGPGVFGISMNTGIARYVCTRVTLPTTPLSLMRTIPRRGSSPVRRRERYRPCRSLIPTSLMNPTAKTMTTERPPILRQGRT